MPFKKPTKKQLDESNILIVRKKSGSAPYRVVPFDTLWGPIKRYLPPAGRYYDQSTLERFTHIFDHEKRCVLCWNEKELDEKCNCESNCTVCDTKQHRGRECHMLYADFHWWRARGHRLRKKAQLRPSPGERAHMVVANVIKDWKKLKSAVIVNMDDPDVQAFYKDKEAPQRLFELPPGLWPVPVPTSTAKSSAFSVLLELEGDVQNTVLGKTAVQLEAVGDSTNVQDFQSGRPRKPDDTIPPIQVGSLSAEDDDSLLDLLDDTWQPPNYHEGRHFAEITPLSVRLAFSSAQQLAVFLQPVASSGGELSTQLSSCSSPQMRTEQTTRSSQPLLTHDVLEIKANRKGKTFQMEAGSKRLRQELEAAREEIRAKDRRIQELELALHESEGWTDTITYRVGQKRLRE